MLYFIYFLPFMANKDYHYSHTVISLLSLGLVLLLLLLFTRNSSDLLPFGITESEHYVSLYLTAHSVYLSPSI